METSSISTFNQVKGYKVFNPDFTCRGFQFEVGKVYEEDVVPSCCDRGFHFCRELKDCFSYYSFNPGNKVAEVVALGDVNESKDNKCCTNKIEIVAEISWEDVLRMVNTGKGNSGLNNTGNCNTGYCNTGDRNTGYYNTGDRNTGDYNTGYCNTGTATPGTTTPGTATPGTTTPGTATPGTATPGTATPGTTTPGTATPGTATPGTTTPGTATPGTTTPGTTTPGTATPGTTTPGTGTNRHLIQDVLIQQNRSLSCLTRFQTGLEKTGYTAAQEAY